MSDTGKKLIDGMTEALAVAKGDVPAARIHYQGHAYVPASHIQALEAKLEAVTAEASRADLRCGAASRVALELDADLATAVEALEKVDHAWDAAVGGHPDYERITGWTGSADNPAQIFAWLARAALAKIRGTE
jgi:uncharacterized protein YPO0396